MAAILKNMQGFDTHGGYTIFGANEEDLQRLDQIPNEYADLVNTLSEYATSTIQTALTAHDKTRIADVQSQGAALLSEWKAILKRLQCSVERTCSLSN